MSKLSILEKKERDAREAFGLAVMSVPKDDALVEMTGKSYRDAMRELEEYRSCLFTEKEGRDRSKERCGNCEYAILAGGYGVCNYGMLSDGIKRIRYRNRPSTLCCKNFKNIWEHMNTIDLVLTQRWYDKIVSGEKKEEYRTASPYWTRRFCLSHNGASVTPADDLVKYDAIVFHRGYTNTTMIVEVKSLKFGKALHSEWGAPPEPCFIFELGEIIGTK